MEIEKHLNQGTLDVSMRGKFTFGDHSAFREVLAKLSSADAQHIVFHMAQVEFVDSAALGMLLLAHDEAEKLNKKIVISGAMGQVRKMFEMAKFNSLFNME